MPPGPAAPVRFRMHNGRVRNQQMEEYLAELSDRVPAPGGGAVAALHAAQAAALLGMVARYSDGPAYAAHAGVVERVREAADTVRDEALSLAEDDAAAFSAVAEAYRMPKDTDEERSVRSAVIAQALAGAAEPPVAVIATAARLVVLAEELAPVGNPQVITDVAAAAAAVRAAAITSRVNIEVNLTGVGDEQERQRLVAVAAGAESIAVRADAVTAAVREKLAS